MSPIPSNVLPVILIVEDKPMTQEIFACALEGDYEVLAAYSLDQAEYVFAANRSRISVISLDGQVPDGDHLSEGLARSFRTAGYAGPMIAASSDASYCTLLVQAGCNETCHGNKDDVPAIIRRLLPLPPQKQPTAKHELLQHAGVAQPGFAPSVS